MQAIMDEPMGFDIPEAEDYIDPQQEAAYKLLRSKPWELVKDYWVARKNYYRQELASAAAQQDNDEAIGKAYRQLTVIEAEIDNFLNFVEGLNEQQEKVVRRRAKRAQAR